MNHTPASANFDLQPQDLHNALIRLQPLGANDFEQLYAVASDPLIWEQHPERERYQREIFQLFFESGLSSGSAFLIFDNVTGQLMGSSRYYEYDKDNDSVAIGYTFLARAYWGGPYNNALKDLMLRYAFRHVSKVYFHVGATNIRSQKAVLKLGAHKVREVIPADNPARLNYEYLLPKEQYLLKDDMA